MNIRSAAILIAIAICSTASAQTSLTLERCLALAQKNSPTLHAAEGAVRSSELARTEVTTMGLPQVRVVTGGIYAPVPPRFGYDPAISNGGQVAGQIAVQQSLYDGGMRSLRLDQLSYDTESLRKERKRTERDLVFTVRETFIGALRAQREVQLQSESVDQLDDYRGIVQRLYNGGNASYTDLLKTEVQLSTANIALQKAHVSLTTARYSLSELTGMPIDSSTSFSGTLDSLVSEVSDTTMEMSAAGFVENLDLGIAGLEIQRSLIDIELAKRERLPVVSLFGDAGYLSSIENLRLPGDERLSGFGYSVGVDIEFPILNWGATGLRIEQREIGAAILQFHSELLRRSLSTEFQKTRLQLIKAKERLRAIRVNLTKTEENFLLTKSKYAGGASLSFEVLTAQQLLTETKLNELQTLSDIQFLSAKLEQLKTQ